MTICKFFSRIASEPIVLRFSSIAWSNGFFGAACVFLDFFLVFWALHIRLSTSSWINSLYLSLKDLFLLIGKTSPLSILGADLLSKAKDILYYIYQNAINSLYAPNSYSSIHSLQYSIKDISPFQNSAYYLISQFNSFHRRSLQEHPK